MKTMTKPGDNLGGLLKIWAVPRSVYTRNKRTVTLSNTDNVYALYCTPETMEFNEPAEETEAGIHYNTEISGFIPRGNSTILDALNDIERKPYVIIFEDGNGDYRAAGTADEPLRMLSAYKSGQNVSSLAGYQFSFSGKTKTRAVYIDNPF